MRGVRRRWALALAFAALVASVVSTIPRAVGQAPSPSPNPYQGLRPGAPGSPCEGEYEIGGTGRCTHGPDPTPPGVDPHRVPAPVAPTPAGFAAATPGVPCYGDGTSGDRVQMLYVRSTTTASRYSTYATSFPVWAAQMDNVFNASAADTGGVRYIRFVTDASCNLSVPEVVIPAGADADMNSTIDAVQAQGYDRSDRKYVMWVDDQASSICGIAQIIGNQPGVTDVPDQSNPSNGNYGGGEFARIDPQCWGLGDDNGQAYSVESHELGHTLGAVQTSAPHATAGNHCYDGYDRMCYNDGSVKAALYSTSYCPQVIRQNRLDCNHDDYFFAGAPPAGSYLASHWNIANSAFLATAAPVTTMLTAPGAFTPVAPTRILDTRPAPFTTGTTAGQVPAFGDFVFGVTSKAGVPASATAVVMNVAEVNGSQPGNLTLYPTGSSLPNTANANWAAGQTVSNLVEVAVGTAGQVTLHNASAAPIDVVYDVFGFVAAASGTAGQYVPVTPTRLMDTRGAPFHVGPVNGPVPSGTVAVLPATSNAVIPATGVAAVALNVTVTGQTGPGNLTVFPDGATQPNVANLNYRSAEDIGNRVIVPVGSGGRIDIANYTPGGSVQLVADVVGYVTDGTAAAGVGSLFTGLLPPTRLADTRSAPQYHVGANSTLGPSTTITVPVAGVGVVPSNAKGVVLNVAVTNTTAQSDLVVYPSTSPLPTAADINWLPGVTRSNLVPVKLGTDGAIKIVNDQGNVDVVVDVLGYYA